MWGLFTIKCYYDTQNCCLLFLNERSYLLYTKCWGLFTIESSYYTQNCYWLFTIEISKYKQNCWVYHRFDTDIWMFTIRPKEPWSTNTNSHWRFACICGRYLQGTWLLGCCSDSTERSRLTSMYTAVVMHHARCSRFLIRSCVGNDFGWLPLFSLSKWLLEFKNTNLKQSLWWGGIEADKPQVIARTTTNQEATTTHVMTSH